MSSSSSSSSSRPRSLSILALSATASALATHYCIYNSDTVMLDFYTTPIIMYLIRTPEFRWYAFRTVDDEDNTPKYHRGIAAIGALLSENALTTVSTILALLGTTSTKTRFFIDSLAFPVIDRINRFFYTTLNKSPSFMKATMIIMQPGSVARTSFVGSILGCAGYNLVFVLSPPALYKHVSLPVFKNFLNRVAPEMREDVTVDRIGGGLVLAVMGYVTIKLALMLKTKQLEEEGRCKQENEGKKTFTIEDVKRFFLDEF